MPRRFLIGLCLLSVSIAKSQTLMPVTDPNKEIIFASDTQAPMWVETLFLKADRNRAATQAIFSNIQQHKPQALFLLGDVVNLGYSDRQWKPMDVYLHSLRNEGVQVDAVLGNHEVMGQPKKGQRKFQERFPNHVRTGYVSIVDSVAIVLLNSNFNTLTPEEDKEQLDWYRKTLNELDADPSVQYIIAGCHHSPYTNSKIVGASTAVQEKFVPPFLASKKARLFLSGHCHGFEHFKQGGKDFIVIGGGGGLHQPLRKGVGCYDDLCADYKPLFHYLSVRRGDDGLQVNSIQLDHNDFTTFEQGFQIKIGGAATMNPVDATAHTPVAIPVKGSTQ